MLDAPQHSNADVSMGRTEDVAMPLNVVPLNALNRAYRASADTRSLVHPAGGLPVLRRFTESFYEKTFADPHIDQLIRSHADPRGERLAMWIAEQMRDGTPYANERHGA